MANNKRATGTDGANGPRGDESKDNTVPKQAQDHLLATFDDVDFGEINDGLGITQLNPQERHGSGGNSVSGQRYLGGPNAGANDDPNMGAHGYLQDPNDPQMPSFDGDDFSENPRNLPHIPPRPGFSNCWIAWFMDDGNIHRDLQRMIRRGYSPVPVSAVPESTARFLQKRRGFDGGEMLSVSGMVLCEIQTERLERLTQAEKDLHKRNERATLTSAQDANRDAMNRGAGGMLIGIDQSDR